MKDKKGFTLIELLAVIVVLGIIMFIVTRSVTNNVKDSKKRVKFLAAKEITEMAAAYLATESLDEDGDGIQDERVSIEKLIYDEYLDKDATNPKTAKSGGDFTNQEIMKQAGVTLQDDYEVKSCGSRECYNFDGYIYYLN